MPPRILRPALAALLALSAICPATAQQPSLSGLVAAHQDTRARELIEETQAGDPYLALHLAQLEGTIRLRDGDVDAAIAIFRAILTADPNFIPAHLELAKALWKRGDTEAAHHHFEALFDGSGDRFVKEYAQRAMRAIEGERPYGFSVSAALLPSTNINRGSGQSDFDAGGLSFTIDDTSRAQSGIGLSLGGAAYYAFRLDANNAITASLGTSLRKYLETAEYDQLTLTPSLTWAHRADDLTLRLGPTLSYQWDAWAPGMIRYGIKGGVTKPLSPNDVISASFAALAQDYVSLDYRDGYQLSGTLALQHHFSPAMNVVAEIGGALERTQRDHLDHDDLSLSVEVNRQWQGGLITSLFAGYEHSRYLGDYPLAGEAREDHEVFVGATVSHRALNLEGFTPELTYQYTRQFSNISFYDYHSHDVSLGLSRAF